MKCVSYRYNLFTSFFYARAVHYKKEVMKGNEYSTYGKTKKHSQ